MASTHAIIHAARHDTPEHVGELVNALNDTQFRVLENRLRRMAHRQELTLHRTRRRDTRAADYGTYALADRDRKPVKSGLDVVDVIRHLIGATQ